MSAVQGVRRIGGHAGLCGLFHKKNTYEFYHNGFSNNRGSLRDTKAAKIIRPVPQNKISQ